MILVAAVLLLVAVGLLAAGLAQGSATLQWGSFAASAVAALVLAVGELQRRRSAAAAAPADRPAATDDAATERADTALVVTPAPAEVPPGHDAHGDRAGGGAAAGVPPTAYDPQPPSAPSLPSAAHAAPEDGPRTGAHAAAPVLDADGEPPVEEVEVTDLLVVLDLTDEVLVVDEHPRYHLAGCPHLAAVETIPVPMDQARTDGFTPCGTCAPDRHLAERERTRRAG